MFEPLEHLQHHYLMSLSCLTDTVLLYLCLQEVLRRGHTLTPERTIPDLVSVSPETEKQRKRNNPTAPKPAIGGDDSEEDDEEEEEDGINVYLNKAEELSLCESSCHDSGCVSRSRTLAVAGHSRSLTAEVPQCEVTHEDQAKDEGAGVCFIPGVQGDVTRMVVEEKEEVYDSSDNIDLFSVTLAALAVSLEEEQSAGDSLTDCLLPTETESHDQTAGAEAADTLSGRLEACETEEEEQEEEEEEEEEFSEYIRHT